MKVRNKSFIVILFAMLSLSTKAQQLPHFTQYMFNDYLINPAVAGTYNYYQIRSVNRYQWVGIQDAPQTYSLSYYGPLMTKDMGIGGYFYTDITGPTSRTGIYGSYAYNVGITDELRLSMGISLGMLQYKVDLTNVGFVDPDDPIEQGQIYSDFVPDASLGVYVHTSYMYFGFAAHQLIGNKLNLFDIESDVDFETGLNKLKQHYYITAGYIYPINVDFAIEPLIILKGVSPAPIQFEGGIKVTYQRMVWLGFSYRSMDAFSTMIGYNYEDKLYFGYSYDLSLSPIRTYNSGTHEVMIGYRFNKVK